MAAMAAGFGHGVAARRRRPSVSPPGLASIEPFRTSATSWAGVVYGPETWTEGGSRSQVMNITLPSGTAPAGGWPTVFYFRSNATVYTIGAGTGLDTYIKQPLLTLGYAVVEVEFRHPVTNVSLGAPHTDVGMALQFARSLHQALNLDRTRMHAVCRSRGSLALWQALQADMANANASTYAGRQSSLLKSLFIIQGQIAYSTQRFADLYIVEADRAALVAANPDDPRWFNTIDAVATAATLPQIAMNHELPWYGAQVTAAQMTADGAQVHFPDAGRLMVAAYEARGQGEKCAAWDNEPAVGDNVEQLADAPYFFAYVDEGMSAVEALTMARARRRGAQAHYMRDDKAGSYVNHDGTGGAPTLGGQVGALTCGQYGLANRVAVTPQGYGMGQSNTANRPLLTTLATGRLGLVFDSTDRMTVPMPSDGTPNVVMWHDSGESSTLVQSDTTRYTVGTTTLDGRKLAFTVGADAAITTNDMKLYRRMATLWSGRAYP